MITFKQLIEILSKVYKNKGFKKAGQTYRLKQDNNIAIINLQKSRDYIPDGFKFTINIGIHFKSLYYFDTGREINTPVLIDDCQWRTRIGELMPIKMDYWWRVQESSNLELLSSELTDNFNSILYPAIQDRISDKLYINELLKNNIIIGNDTYKRLMNLCSFFCIYDDNRLCDTLEELKLYCSKNRLDYSYQSILAQIKSWKNKPEGQCKWGFFEDSYKWVMC